jgi:hypothetical protein
MMIHSVLAERAKGRRFYYRCRTRNRDGAEACSHRKCHRADQVESRVWDLISGLLKDPGRLKAGLEEMIEQERAGLRGDPDQEAKSWLAKLAEVDQERRGYLRLAAKGRLTDEELDEALAELEDARETAEKELRAVRARREVLENLERDRDALLESYANMTPAALDALSPEERHQIYKMLRIMVEVSPDGSLNVTGVLGDSFVFEHQDERVGLGHVGEVVVAHVVGEYEDEVGLGARLGGAGVAHAIAIGISLVRVRDSPAVVRRIRHPVAVGVCRRRSCARVVKLEPVDEGVVGKRGARADVDGVLPRPDRRG